MKSPLKKNPLRNPGQSLDEEIHAIILDEATPYLTVVILFVLMAILEWLRWYTESPPSPILYTGIAAMSLALFIPKFIKYRKTIKNLKQGRDGEKAVGQYLENLRDRGCKIFHDIPGEGFNLDHVVVSETGVYVIETKTYSKPDSGPCVILYDGESVRFNGENRNEKAIIQVKAEARWLGDFLKENTGKKFEIKPVVVFPGWFVEFTAEAKKSDVWVLNPKALPSFIKNSRSHLTPEDVHLAASRISMHTRG